MAELTSRSMHDARDAEDKRLLDAGEIELLLAGWYETIVGRCVARMRGPAGHDVAQAVCERLWRELKRGRHRDGRYPFRVIVAKVVEFTCKGWFEQSWREDELIEIDAPLPDPAGDVDTRLDLEAFVATLAPADADVGRLWLLDLLEPDQIAKQLGKEPNAVYQARFRITKRLREWLEW